MKLASMAASGVLVGGIIGNITKGLLLSTAIGSSITFNAMRKSPLLNNNLLSGFVDLAMTMAKKQRKGNYRANA